MAQQFEMLSFGVLLVITALVLVLYGIGTITGLDQVLALIITFYGLWTIGLAGIRTRNPEKYGRGARSTLAMGVILTAIGGAWYLNIATQGNLLLSVVLLLLVIGILAVASALPSMRQKE